MNDDVTILVQGPRHPRGMAMLDTYTKLGKVIVSTWSHPEVTELDTRDDIFVIAPDFEQPRCFNRGNVYLQALTTYYGLRFVETPWVVKVRFDESFSNLQPFIDSMKANREKLTCTNAYMGKGYSLNMSDHIIGGEWVDMLGTFTRAKVTCEHKQEWPDKFPPRGEHFGLPVEFVITETILFTSYLAHKAVPLTQSYDEQRKQMREHLNIVPVDLLGEFLIACNNNNQYLTDPAAVQAYSDGIKTTEDI